VLNQPTPDDLFNLSQEADIAQLEEITVEEVVRAMHKLKNKAVGLNDESAELLKHGNDAIATELAYLFNLIYKNEDVPDDWRHGIIVTLPKKVRLQ